MCVCKIGLLFLVVLRAQTPPTLALVPTYKSRMRRPPRPPCSVSATATRHSQHAAAHLSSPHDPVSSTILRSPFSHSLSQHAPSSLPTATPLLPSSFLPSGHNSSHHRRALLVLTNIGDRLRASRTDRVVIGDQVLGELGVFDAVPGGVRSSSGRGLVSTGDGRDARGFQASKTYSLSPVSCSALSNILMRVMKVSLRIVRSESVLRTP